MKNALDMANRFVYGSPRMRVRIILDYAALFAAAGFFSSVIGYYVDCAIDLSGAPVGIVGGPAAVIAAMLGVRLH